MRYYISLLLLFSLIFACSEPTKPEKEKELFTVVVTGNINETTPSGSQPLAGCNVTLIATNVTTISQTDSNGVFLDTLITIDDTFRLKIEKAGFLTIDTVLQRNNVGSLNFMMNAADVVISGTVWENTPSGSQPSDSCRISIITSEGTTVIYSDPNGDYLRNVATEDIIIRLLLEKDGFETIDTTLSIQNTIGLELFLYKYINYFPLKVGNKWKYSGRYYPGGDYIWYDYEGEEWWELTELANDSSWFKIVTDFTGLKIEKVWGSPRDTIYLYNEIAEITLNNNNGILSLNSTTGSDNSLLEWFFGILNQTGIAKPRITYPVNFGDTISVFIEDDHDFLKYDLIKNIGFDTLAVQYRPVDILIISAYLGLLEYNIQK